jgi:hypothetical protein
MEAKLELLPGVVNGVAGVTISLVVNSPRHGSFELEVAGQGVPVYKLIKKELIPMLLDRGIPESAATDLVNQGLKLRGMGLIHMSRGRSIHAEAIY